jgi:hypothetical protein
MRRRNLALVLAVVLGFAFAFFVPVVYPDCYPLTCRTDGHACVGACFPAIGSITYWVTGYGGALVPDYYSNSIRPALYQVFLP